VAVELARELGRGKTIVTVLPDSGNSYISKMYSDEWMRDNGFLVEERGPGTVRDVIAHRKLGVISARKGERIGEVVETMRQHGISQMPVNDERGRAMGMIHEYDLLNALVSGAHRIADPIDPIIAPMQGVVSPGASIQQLRDVFAQDNVAVVKEAERVIGIVTKIDVIEYLATRMGQ
jgi:cystathionine beta-synthase